jgi:hypothetical protein
MGAVVALFCGSSRVGGTVLVSIVVTHTKTSSTRPGHNLDSELNFYIPVLSTSMCPPIVITTRDTIKLILGEIDRRIHYASVECAFH